MKVLRTFLYAGAAVWAVSGLALAIAPRFVLHEAFHNPRIRDYALVRILGVVSVGLAMLMVLVAQRLEEVWWWAWAFILTSAGITTVAVLHASFGDQVGRAGLMLWLIGAANAVLCAGLLVGMGRTAQERPFA